jgi:hypothetical protein
LAEEYAARVKRVIKSGKLTAADVAAATIEAMKADRFYNMSCHTSVSRPPLKSD